MTSSPLFYWFFDSNWWMGASQGAVGALIGFLGLFVAYEISRLGDKNKRLEERTLSGVASIMQLSLALNHKQLDEVKREEIHALETELMLFYVHQVQKRPKTAQWAQTQSLIISVCPRNDEGVAAVRKHSIKIATELTSWLTGGCEEGDLNRDAAMTDLHQVLEDCGAVSVDAPRPL